MHQDVPVVEPDAPLPEVLEKLVASPLRRVVVLDASGKVRGIVLDRDLVKHYAGLEKPGLLRSLLSSLSSTRSAPSPLEGSARDIMKTEVYSVRTDTPLSEVITIMVERKVKRLVVVDEHQRLKGMIDREKVLQVLAM